MLYRTKRRHPIKINRTFITAFAAGAAAGVITALLYAPTDGATLRSNISEKASGSVDAASEKVETLTVRYGQTYQTARFQVERLFTAVSAGVEEGRRVKEEVQKVLTGEI